MPSSDNARMAPTADALRPAEMCMPRDGSQCGKRAVSRAWKVVRWLRLRRTTCPLASTTSASPVGRGRTCRTLAVAQVCDHDMRPRVHR